VNPAREYSWAQFNDLINGALAYRTAFSSLYKHYAASYDRPFEIPVHPEFSPDPDERAIVMVRERHGVIGIKDAWTREQIRARMVPWRLVRFFPDEARLLEEDPARALFPPRA
jgi:hypothetical protein